MPRFKDFDAARAEREGDPLSFRLGGEDFTTSGTLPAGLLLDIGRAMAAEDDMAAFAAFSGFFDSIVPVDQADRFARAIRTVGLDTMMELLAWIVEESTGRPLSKPSPSPAASSTGGEQSRVVSLSPAASRSA